MTELTYIVFLIVVGSVSTAQQTRVVQWDVFTPALSSRPYLALRIRRTE